MKNNRDKEESPLQSTDQLLQKGSSESIPVFLVLAIFILSVPFFSGSQYFPRNKLSQPPADFKVKYVWISGSPEFKEGLYLFTQEQLKNNFPDIHSLLAKGISREVNPLVSAVLFTDDKPQAVNLPPPVANIFFQPIPINRAAKSILTSLPGIGPVLAEKIVQRRDKEGPFNSKEELLHIAGIGPKKYADLVGRITLD